MKASEEIDRIFFDKKFSAAKYMLRYIVGAPDDVRQEQLQTITRYNKLADQEIAGVVDANYSNFNASLGKFTGISNQLQGKYIVAYAPPYILHKIVNCRRAIGPCRSGKASIGRKEHFNIKNEES
jgi:hypothetical protein